MKHPFHLPQKYPQYYSTVYKELSIKKAHEGKGLLNTELNKLYKSKKYIKGKRHFEEIVVRCIAIMNNMLSLRYCGWSEDELKKVISDAVQYAEAGHDNSLADFYGGQGRLISCDGHRVRSKSELIIDLWLVSQGIKHDYEKKIFHNGELMVVSDFYLPKYDCYIEYWGLEGDQLYEQRKREKMEFYKSKNLRLISLYNEDLKNLDESLNDKLNAL
ncbi:hypothetical protein HCG49_18195 [Arenibacter sp. 6A1]|uniref:hypothetical protein n=1 Tax=Arenibacter sp. 6A1 TaxID=2720391 RepID=UPI001446ECD6|nr:hypothetical protein [Arenibacter sp. 6A1]NKI28484.1 hypothetical protein [Arenibacter sp. 6A1]